MQLHNLDIDGSSLPLGEIAEDRGLGTIVSAAEVIVIINPDSAPIQRIISRAQEEGRLMDLTKGASARKTPSAKLSAIFHCAPNHTATPGNIILAAMSPETFSHRFSITQSSLKQSYYSANTEIPMNIQLINIGFGNIVSANRVVAIVSPESAPIKRIVSEARSANRLIDATYGRRTRAVIVTDSAHVILSAIQPETVAHRFVTHKDGQNNPLEKKPGF